MTGDNIKGLNDLIKEYSLDPDKTLKLYNDKIDDYIERDLYNNKLCEVNLLDVNGTYGERAIKVFKNYLGREINSEIDFRNKLLGVINGS